MNEFNLLTGFLGSLSMGEPLTFEGLTLLPLRDGAITVLSCLILEEALARGAFIVGEIGGGTVPELLLRNGTDERVFLLDGEELVGAKQNRILNTSLLVERRSEVKIPVSCVERGRWQFTEAARMRASGMAHPSLRGATHGQVSDNLRARRSYASDQSAVWQAVDGKLAAMGVESQSASLDEIYEQRGDALRDYAARLPCPEAAIGVAVAIGGRLACGDLFATPDLLRRLWPRLVASYALDAFEGRGKVGAAVAAGAVRAFLAPPAERSVGVFASPGLGASIRFRDGGREGSALVVDDFVVHLEVFPVDAGEADCAAGSRIRRPSMRGRRRIEPFEI